jgi:hypothetical protein
MKFGSILGIALVLAVAVWLAAWGEDWRHAYAFTGRQDDSYNLLVHGFLQRHLYMDAPVDPRLLSPDVAVRRQANVEADASFYRGRYYIYFGVVPAALLFLPYRLLTGQDLSDNAACVALVLLGFLLYLKTYEEARRRYFPALSHSLRACSVLLLAFGAGTPALLILSGRYEIAIAGGYACMAGAWLAVFRAGHSPRRAAAWLGVAGAAFGLAIGCRPTYILIVPALTAALWLMPTPPPAGAARVRLAAAAVLPAFFIGLLLASYNYARFGNPLEFGFHYQANNNQWLGHGQNISGSSAAFFWTDLQWYYLRLPSFSPYFPYVFPLNFKNPPVGYVGGEPCHGQWPAFLLTLCCGIVLVPLWRRRAAFPSRLAALMVPLAAGFACMLAGLACFSGITNRYIVDFQGSLVLLLALVGGYAAVFVAPARGWIRGWRAGFGALAAATAAFSILVSLQYGNRFEQTRPRTYAFLAHYGNYPAALLARWGLLRSGPVHFSIVLAPVTLPTQWPLLATGLPGYTDVLYLIQHPQGLAQFMIQHEGHYEARSALLPVTLGRAYAIEADLGSLYPPIGPYFRGWKDQDVETLKTRALVLLDGQAVIHQKMTFYDAPPNWVFLGKNPAGIDLPFAGEIRGGRRLPPGRPGSRTDLADVGVWRLQIGLPLREPEAGHPLLGSGTQGRGNLLLMQAAPDRRIRFSLDQWNFALTHSPTLPPPAPGVHRLEIFAGPQVARQTLPPDWHLPAAALQPSKNLLRVWLDGELVWTAEVTVNLDSYGEVALGNNPQGFSTANSYFLGSLANAPYSPVEMREFIEKNVRQAPGRLRP